MTCCVCYWPETFRLEVYAAFPSSPHLMTRGQEDAVGDLYLRMERTGELWLTSGRATDIKAFVGMLAVELEGEDVTVIADRYRWDKALDALDYWGLNWHTEFRGTGAGPDTAEDIRNSQRLMQDGKVKSLPSLVLQNAIMGATVKMTGTNQHVSLDVHKSTARIDAATALIHALGAAERVQSVEVWDPVVI